MCKLQNFHWSFHFLLEIFLEILQVSFDFLNCVCPFGRVLAKQVPLVAFPNSNVGFANLGINHNTDGVFVNAHGGDIRTGEDLLNALNCCIAFLRAAVSVARLERKLSCVCACVGYWQRETVWTGGECQKGIDVKPIHQRVVVVQELTYVTRNETLGMATVSFFLIVVVDIVVYYL